MELHIGKAAEGYSTALLVAQTVPCAQYGNEILVQNIAGHWWNNGWENRCTVEEHLSRCHLPTANPTQSGLGSNPVAFAMNKVALELIFLRLLPLFPVKILLPTPHARWTYVFL
jgi:hypothetical protein